MRTRNHAAMVRQQKEILASVISSIDLGQLQTGAFTVEALMAQQQVEDIICPQACRTFNFDEPKDRCAEVDTEKVSDVEMEQEARESDKEKTGTGTEN